MLHSASTEKETVTPADLNQHHFPGTSGHRGGDTLRSYLYHVISIKNRSPGTEEKLDRTSIEALFFIVNGSSIVVSVSCEAVYVRISTENPGENFFHRCQATAIEPAFLNFKMSPTGHTRARIRVYERWRAHFRAFSAER